MRIWLGEQIGRLVRYALYGVTVVFVCFTIVHMTVTSVCDDCATKWTQSALSRITAMMHVDEKVATVSQKHAKAPRPTHVVVRTVETKSSKPKGVKPWRTTLHPK